VSTGIEIVAIPKSEGSVRNDERENEEILQGTRAVLGALNVSERTVTLHCLGKRSHSRRVRLLLRLGYNTVARR
jgi:hypothetical protein